MLQTELTLVPNLPPGITLNAAQTQAIKEVGAALERSRLTDKTTFIALYATSGTGKSTVLDALREPLERLGVKVLEDREEIFRAGFPRDPRTRYVVPLLPGTRIKSLLPGVTLDPRLAIEEINMHGFTKDELRPRIPRDLRMQPSEVIEAMLDLSHGSTSLLQILVRELKANGLKPLTPEAGADLALGFLAHNLQSNAGTPSPDQYKKFCADFTSGEFKLGIELTPDAIMDISNARMWMMSARRTSAEFREQEPWTRYARLAGFADNRGNRLDEPGISVFGVSQTPEDTRRLVAISEQFEQLRLQHEEGVHYRKTRVAVYSAPEFKRERGWSTYEDSIDPLRNPILASEPRAHSILEVHTHEHYFEGKFLQLAALTEAGLRKAGLPYYLSFHAGNAHPVTVYYDPAAREMQPVTFTALRYLGRAPAESNLLGHDTDTSAWRLVETALRESAAQGGGNAVVSARGIIPMVSSEYYRERAPHLVAELEEKLNISAATGERYQVLTIQTAAQCAKGGTRPTIREDATSIVLVGYGDYKFREHALEIQTALDGMIGARKLIVIGESLDPESFTEQTPWGAARFKDPVLRELSFQRKGIHSVPLKLCLDTSEPGMPFTDWRESGAAALFER